MKTIKLLLIPTPGVKPEFLADLALVVVDKEEEKEASLTASIATEQQQHQQLWHSLPNEIVLEGYTRDAWAWKQQLPNTAAACTKNSLWQTLRVESTDGRNKLPGFLSYLKERQKSAYGRFNERSLWTVSYAVNSKPPSSSPKKESQQRQQTEPIRMNCRICTDFTRIGPKCNLQPLGAPVRSTNSSMSSSSSSSKAVAPAASSGFLGRLVGAQQRTNHHVAVATTTSSAIQPPMTASTSTSTTSPKSAQTVLSEFRQSMQEKMLDFDLQGESQPVLRVHIVLSHYTTGLMMTTTTAASDTNCAVTMELLKYIVYEAADEVNDAWVAMKEPSEFLDDVWVAVYKEGAVPLDVLEELNQGELPMEVRAAQKHVQEQHRRAAAAQQQGMQAHYGGPDDEEAEEEVEELAALNTKKRDRRTIEDYEKERKRGKPVP
jgi:hypothetical protein